MRGKAEIFQTNETDKLFFANKLNSKKAKGMCFKKGLNLSTDVNVSSREIIVGRNSYTPKCKFSHDAPEASPTRMPVVVRTSLNAT